MKSFKQKKALFFFSSSSVTVVVAAGPSNARAARQSQQIIQAASFINSTSIAPVSSLPTRLSPCSFCLSPPSPLLFGRQPSFPS